MIKITQFGNPILRQKANSVKADQILGEDTQMLIKDLHNILVTKKLGVGLAAPQVGVSLAVAVVHIQPTEHRPEVEELNINLINPKLIRTFGSRKQMWEGCISSGAGKAGLFARVPRYSKIEVEFYDETAQKRKKIYEGLAAHVIQHEIDHLEGVLFVDRVTDTKSYMTYTEYLKAKSKKLLD